MPGPAPDPLSLRELRREREGTVRTLPQVRKGDIPKWPLSKATVREMTVWREVWALPQAVIWEESKSFRQVGMYVRTSVEAEERGATPAMRSLLLRQETNLLLVESALLRAGYRISVFSAPETPQPTAKSTGRPVVDVRSRWAQDRRHALESMPDSRSRLRPRSGDDDD
jgi:hypothetical protein